jgi:hypothetical protein
MPGSPQAWLDEIQAAYQDAAEAMPFSDCLAACRGNEAPTKHRLSAPARRHSQP